MIEVCAAGSLRTLAKRLAESLRGRADPFRPETVVVPRHAMRAWLQLALARQLGIACNLHLIYIDAFFMSLVPPARREELRILERDVLQSALIKAFEDEALLGLPACAGLRDYLLHGGDADADAVVHRRCQLAEALSGIFSDYALTRPAMVGAWSQGQATLSADAELAPVELWQAAVWRELFEADHGLRTSLDDGPRHAGLAGLLEALPGGELVLPERVHVFGFSSFAAGYVDLLRGLAERCDVHLYLLTPCLQPRPPGTHLLAHLWGQPSREFLRRWRDLTREQPDAVKMIEVQATSIPSSVLGALQRSLAGGRPLAEPPPSDGSLRILACPSRQREVEAVAAGVWHAVRESADTHRPLRFDEIAVAVVDPLWETYRNRIRPVFAEAHRIPLSLLELPAMGESRIAEAVRLLFDLPLGPFDRDGILRLLVHPAVQAAIPDADPQQWLVWCEELKVLRGADRADVADSYLTRDLYTFDQGARRLALGVFIEGSDDDHPAPIVSLDGQAYLTHSVAPGQHASAGCFLLLLRSLTADVRFAKTAQLPLEDWSIFLRRLLTTYLHPEGDDARLLGRVLGKLAHLDALDLDGRALPYRVVYELACQGLEQLRITRGQPLCDGVVVGPLGALAGVPFRALFVLGLDEGTFPGQAWHDPLDLRQAQRLPGDVSPRDRDRAAFSLALSAAAERVTLSYVCRSEVAGETLAPSSLVGQLESGLRQAGLPDDVLADLWRWPPLRRFSPRAFPPPLGDSDRTREALSEARREAQARALRADVQQRLPADAGWPPSDELVAHLAPAAREALDPLLATCPPGVEPRPLAGAQRLPLRAVLAFLSSPLQAWGRYRLGFRSEEDGDVLSRQDEPFETPIMQGTLLLRDAFYDALARVPTDSPLEDAPLQEAYDDRVLRAELQGTLPTGVFLRVERDRHVEMLRCWLRNVTRQFADDDLRGLAVHRFGQAVRRGRSDVLAPPLELRVDLGRPEPLIVRLHGSTLPVFGDGWGTLQLVLSKQASLRHVLRGFFDHVVLAASGRTCQGPYQAVISPAWWANLENAKHYRGFTPFTQDEARAYLQALLRELYTGSHGVLFPVEVTANYVAEWHHAGAAPGDLARRIQASRNDSWRQDSDDYGPVPHPERFAPPLDGDDLAWARLSPLVTRRLDPPRGDA